MICAQARYVLKELIYVRTAGFKGYKVYEEMGRGLSGGSRQGQVASCKLQAVLDKLMNLQFP